MKTKSLAIIAAVVVLSALAIAAAAYVMTSPMSDDVVVNPPVSEATLSKVTVSATTLTVGDSLTLSTTVSDGMQGITVTFFNQNDVNVGTAVTDETGTATVTVICGFAGTWSFYATATHP